MTNIGNGYTVFGQTQILGISSPFWFMAVIVLVFTFLVGRTRYFRQGYDIGGNPKAAKLSGINVDRTVFSFFVIMGLLAGLAGALLASRMNTAVVLAGNGVELKVITAVVLGGASLAGEVGTIEGAFLGVPFMALLQNAMIVAGINPFWQLIVVGLVLPASVGLDQPARGPALAEGPTGLDAPIGDPSRADQEYVWISNASNLPPFVERVYPGFEAARRALNVKARIAGPTSVDLAAFITTVDAECAKNPAGVIVVGGWDDALASEVDKCIDKKVPAVVTDGDLPMSKRPTYLGTNWYDLGYQHGQYQCRYHHEAGLAEGQIGTISFLAASNFIRAGQGLRDALAKECPSVTVVADEESGTNVEQVAANTAAIIEGPPNRTDMVGFDPEAGPGIVRAVTEAGRAGQIIVTSNEAGRDFINSIKDGS